MTAKGNFTDRDRKDSYNPIGAMQTAQKAQTGSDTEKIREDLQRAVTDAVERVERKRQIHRLNPKEAAPERYILTVEVPGEYGRYLKARAGNEWLTTTEYVRQIIEEDMQRHPEVIEQLQAIDKKREKKKKS